MAIVLQEMTDRVTQGAGSEGLDWSIIVDSLPTDPGSIFGILMAVGFMGAVLYFGLKTSRPTPSDRSGADGGAEVAARTGESLPSLPQTGEPVVPQTGRGEFDPRPGRRTRRGRAA